MLLLGIAAFLPAGCWNSDDPAQNVIIISIDTLRADRLGCYGYERPTSPFLDCFAASGTLFENAVAQAPWTLPSHTTMLTGKFPHRNGVVDESKKLSRNVPTLAAMLSDRGFITGAFVNSHWISAAQGLDQGFLTFKPFKETIGNMGKAITTQAVDWLKQYSKKPFFLFIHYYDVHSSYSPDPRYRAMFTRPYSGTADGSTGELLAVRDGTHAYSDEDVGHVSDLYDAEIRQLDDQLKRLFGHVRDLDLDKNTLVVITSDHGEEFMEHGCVLHGRTMYSEIINVPLVMRGPGVPENRRVEELAMVADIVPTALARLGIDHAHALDGTDLIDAIENKPASFAERLVFAEADWRNEEPDIWRMVQNRRFRFCFNRLTGEKTLFDLQNDPAELNDISGEHPELVAEFARELEQFLTGRTKAGTIDPRSEEEIELLKSLGYF